MPGFMRRRLQHRGRNTTARDLAEIVTSSQKVAEALRLERHRSTWLYNRAISIQRQAVIAHRMDFLHSVDEIATQIRNTIPD